MIRSNTFNYYAALMTVAAGATALLCGCKSTDKPTVVEAVKVDVQVMGQGTDGPGSRTYSGTTESASTSTVSFSVPGTITAIYTEVGNKVTKGQVLAKVKSESLINASNIAQAELEEARDAYRRLKILHDANALPEIKWTEVQAKLKQAENAAEMARRGVSDATITSPISGYVAEKFADIGQTVAPSQPVLSIVDINDMQIAISVTDEEIAEFGQTNAARITFDNNDTIAVEGRLNQKSVVANPLTRSYTVKYSIPNPGGKILPGMIGNVVVENSAKTSPDRHVYILPSQAVLLDSDNRLFVWTVSGGKAERKYVSANELSDGGVIVESGLASGDSVIVSGMQKVSTGSIVTTK